MAGDGEQSSVPVGEPIQVQFASIYCFDVPLLNEEIPNALVDLTHPFLEALAKGAIVHHFTLLLK